MIVCSTYNTVMDCSHSLAEIYPKCGTVGPMASSSIYNDLIGGTSKPEEKSATSSHDVPRQRSTVDSEVTMMMGMTLFSFS